MVAQNINTTISNMMCLSPILSAERLPWSDAFRHSEEKARPIVENMLIELSVLEDIGKRAFFNSFSFDMYQKIQSMEEPFFESSFAYRDMVGHIKDEYLRLFPAVVALLTDFVSYDTAT